MIIIPPSSRRRRARAASSVPAPAVAPTLVSATVASDFSTLTLAFDRAIDISAFDGSTAYVNLPAANSVYQPDIEIVQIDARTLRASLDYLEPSSGSQATLTVNPPTGIVAADGGGTWAGCDAVPLPLGP